MTTPRCTFPGCACTTGNELCRYTPPEQPAPERDALHKQVALQHVQRLVDAIARAERAEAERDALRKAAVGVWEQEGAADWMEGSEEEYGPGMWKTALAWRALRAALGEQP